MLSLTRRRVILATVVPSRRLFHSGDTPGPEADRQNGLVNVSHSGVAVVLVISRAFVGYVRRSSTSGGSRRVSPPRQQTSRPEYPPPID